MRNLFLFVIRGYQWVLRPLMGTQGPTCRFYPSCSCYAHQAIEIHGAWRGLRMTLSRISRCHPWNAGGYDPVEPSPGNAKSTQQSTSVSHLN